MPRGSARLPDINHVTLQPKGEALGKVAGPRDQWKAEFLISCQQETEILLKSKHKKTQKRVHPGMRLAK